jgi:hypothetical protein
MKELILKTGMFRLSNKVNNKEGELSVFKFIKKILSYLRVTVADPCCPTTTSPTRYNETTDVVEYYNQVTNTWDSAQSTLTNAWSITGNGGTNPNTNFIGTTDNVDFRFKRNNLNSGYLAGANTAFGLNSGNPITESGLNPTQFGNLSIGISAGNNSVGNENTFFGNGAGVGNTDDQVTCIGLQAGYRNRGLNLTALGFSAGIDNLGVNSTALGASSGWSNSGDNVISIGFRSNENNTGNKVIALGENAGKNNIQSNRFIIGQDYLPTFADEAAAIAAGLPLPSVNGIYLYIDASTNYVRARI